MMDNDSTEYNKFLETIDTIYMSLRGDFQRVKYGNGRYDGYFVNGKRNGYGVYYFDDG